MIWALLVACAISRSGGEPSDDDVFPHEPHYARIEAHGRDATSHPIALCLSCHVDGGSAPSCTSCHAAYPHRDGWRDGDAHGVGLTGASEACSGCHAEGNAAGPCTQCHGSFPHPEGWADPGVHAVYARSRGDTRASCGPCHDTALVGGEAPACNSCHADYPHPSGWAASHDVPLDGCPACHEPEGGIAGVPCARCHPAFPHPEGWRTEHLRVADQAGEPTCMGCHDAGDGGTTALASCSGACHGG